MNAHRWPTLDAYGFIDRAANPGDRASLLGLARSVGIADTERPTFSRTVPIQKLCIDRPIAKRAIRVGNEHVNNGGTTDKMGCYHRRAYHAIASGCCDGNIWRTDVGSKQRGWLGCTSCGRGFVGWIWDLVDLASLFCDRTRKADSLCTALWSALSIAQCDSGTSITFRSVRITRGI